MPVSEIFSWYSPAFTMLIALPSAIVSVTSSGLKLTSCPSVVRRLNSSFTPASSRLNPIGCQVV